VTLIMAPSSSRSVELHPGGRMNSRNLGRAAARSWAGLLDAMAIRVSS